MGRKKAMSTDEKINACKCSIKNTEEELSSLNNELKKLYKIKEQEDKDYIYNTIIKNGLSIEEAVNKVLGNEKESESLTKLKPVSKSKKQEEVATA